MDFTPIFRSRLTDIAGCLINFQQQKRCRDLEMNFMECMEAYGIPRGYQKCSDQFEDFNECALGWMQRERYVTMRQERERQYRAGILKEKYSTPPTEDSY